MTQFSTFQEISMPETHSFQPKVDSTNILAKFYSDSDEGANFLYSKLVLLFEWKKSLNKDVLKTKDSILDLATQVFALYGIKLKIIYQDVNTGKGMIRGIKDIDNLHDCIAVLIHYTF
eukprot:CAMPEP_0114576136 /NCGR_PEP_ID=MMETSP0125-20121206/924_1 /TAXON_ID=485358 ORGANISM="Aristerostoma sp., Strain ATCC 50986" /NCGR_SAMPLE_ID=MMETSP0125 /ASSEMBLY_ACC=CAM_ASM_000245 /LENGTH=117 /DNA_ID=CAMNT_0001764401 /DNA_START=168 /DNA_END=521 /DNA_ORIENTATION=-